MSNKPSDDSLDKIFFALSDKNRRKILKTLSKEESSVSVLAELLSMSLPGVLKHIGILEEAKLIVQEKNGRIRSCTFNPKGFKNANSYIDDYKEFWESKLDNLEKFLQEED